MSGESAGSGSISDVIGARTLVHVKAVIGKRKSETQKRALHLILGIVASSAKVAPGYGALEAAYAVFY